MKIYPIWRCAIFLGLFPLAAWARTWELPVMATWTEDPRTTVTLA